MATAYLKCNQIKSNQQNLNIHDESTNQSLSKRNSLQLPNLMKMFQLKIKFVQLMGNTWGWQIHREKLHSA